MELIAAIALAGPLGFFVRSRPLLVYLVVWAVIFPIQTVVVHADNADDISPIYFIVNAAILVGGVALNKLGTRLRRRGVIGRPRSADR
jgi:hypothetical protein